MPLRPVVARLHRIGLQFIDEPTRNLSPLSCPVIREALSAYGGAILSVTHDRKFMREVCTDWYELTETGLRPLERL